MPTSKGGWSSRRKVLLPIVLGVILALLGGYLLVQRFMLTPTSGCEVRVADGSSRVALSFEQARHATTIAAVADGRQLPERALTIALATAYQESQLHNIEHGDRDSLGLFQQRPSQGWGTSAQVRDPVYATNKFFDALVKISGYARLPLTVAAQRVQHSGHPQAYAKHESKAALLAGALSGRRGGALNCTLTHQPNRPASVSSAARTLRQKMHARFGNSRPDGVSRQGGRRVDFPVSEGSRGGDAASSPAPSPSVSPSGGAAGEQVRFGWVLAQWLVAHAQRLHVDTVRFDGSAWRRSHSEDGWHDSEQARADRVRVTLVRPDAQASADGGGYPPVSARN